MKIIGITGGVGAGKSQVLSYIKDNFNCIVVLADDIANKLKEPNEVCYLPMLEVLGTDVLDDTGAIDKKKMAQVIFSNPEILEKVNAIIHPAVIDCIKQMADDARDSGKIDYFFIEAALLIENGFNDYVDEMWYIYARDEVRRLRLKESRGYSDEKIDSIMASQLSEQEFRDNTDAVIDNSDDLNSTYRQIDRLL